MIEYAVIIPTYNRPASLATVLRAVPSELRHVTFVFPDASKTSINSGVSAEINSILKCYIPTDNILRYPNHLGCMRNIQRALTYACRNFKSFSFIEDDCVPTPPFFEYTSHYLQKFQHRSEVIFINGMRHERNFFGLYGRRRSDELGYVPKFWGWSTWSAKLLPLLEYSMEIDIEAVSDVVFEKHETYRSSFHDIGRSIRVGRLDTWDYQLLLSALVRGARAISPQSDLVRNIGFSNDLATHTKKFSFDVFRRTGEWSQGICNELSRERSYKEAFLPAYRYHWLINLYRTVSNVWSR
jgi:hypothetical protein